MKRISILFIGMLAIGQVSFTQHIPFEEGGGAFTFEHSEDQCLSEADRSAIQMRLRANANQLMEEGKLNFSPDRVDVEFQWPLRKAAGFEWNDYYGISAFVDQDPTGGILDYNCDSRTYGGHFGTDYFTWPFPWYLVENELVEVIAGEAGVIIAKDDGFDDDHCDCFGSWNAVYVQHADGSVAWYGHLKKGSLTTKLVGDAVAQGEYLGVVASSGCSTGPHLHLEVYDAAVNLIDPYAGACNDLNPSTWWEVQPPHRTPRINVLLTHDVLPEHGCPAPNENPHFQNDYDPGDSFYTAGYFHDALAGTSTNYRIVDANGDIWQSWSGVHGTTFNASWWWWGWTLPVEGPFGVWSFEADYNGETVTHPFNYGVYAQIEKFDQATIVFSPNPSDNGLVTVAGLSNPTNVQILNVLGEQVTELFLEPNGQLDLSQFANGMYYLRLENEQNSTYRILLTK